MRTKNDYVYDSWRKMHVRCYDASYHAYHRYGGRGIRVDDWWREYANFKADMWDSWFPGATVERKDNDGNYSPENCVWKPKAENTKPRKYDEQEMLQLHEGGMSQRQIGELFGGLTQDRVSKLLKRARNDKARI